MVHDSTELHEAQMEKDHLIEQLQNSLSEIKNLKGILPICSYCKKIRDDEGNWKQLEVYIHNKTEAYFSHGVCPECNTLHYHI